jgi:predicted dehydrogenase
MGKIRWGLIGCGDIAQKCVAPAMRDLPNCEPLAVSRADFSLAREFAMRFGFRRWYKTWQELVSDDEIDAVYVATPVNLHCEQTICAAEHGKHVLCEKPMAMNVEQCDKMLAACKSNSVTLGISYYRHFYPVINRLKEILASGEIGKPVFAEIRTFEFFNPDPNDKRSWFVRKDIAGGGPMFDSGSHRLEVLVNLFGTVRSVKGSFSNIAFKREVEDTCTGLITFESGLHAVVTTSHIPVQRQDTLEIFGSDGYINVPSLNNGIFTLTKNQQSRTESHPRASNVHLPLIENFTNALLSNTQPAVTGEIGKAVASIEQQIYTP